MNAADRRKVRKRGFQRFHMADQQILLFALENVQMVNETPEQTARINDMIHELGRLTKSAVERHRGLTPQRRKVSGCVLAMSYVLDIRHC
jgi:hypothetical protein